MKNRLLLSIVLALFVLAPCVNAGEPGQAPQANRESVMDYLPFGGRSLESPPVSIQSPRPALESPQSVSFVSPPAYSQEAEIVAPKRSWFEKIGSAVAWLPRVAAEIVSLSGSTTSSVVYSGADLVENSVIAFEPNSDGR